MGLQIDYIGTILFTENSISKSIFPKIEEIQTVPTSKSALNFNLPQKIEKICNGHDLTCVRKVK